MEALPLSDFVEIQRQGWLGVDRPKAPEMALDMNRDVCVEGGSLPHRCEHIGSVHQIINVELVVSQNLHSLGGDFDPQVGNDCPGEQVIGVVFDSVSPVELSSPNPTETDERQHENAALEDTLARHFHQWPIGRKTSSKDSDCHIA